jgi:hypothetical protein
MSKGYSVSEKAKFRPLSHTNQPCLFCKPAYSSDIRFVTRHQHIIAQRAVNGVVCQNEERPKTVHNVVVQLHVATNKVQELLDTRMTPPIMLNNQACWLEITNPQQNT